MKRKRATARSDPAPCQWGSLRDLRIAHLCFAAFALRCGQAGAATTCLQGVETATSVRLRSGKVETMDGPFAETREHLGGYYVIEVPDLDAALRYAAMVPAAAWGTVEVRPLLSYNPAEQ